MSLPDSHEGAAMQESVVPRQLPVVPGLDVAATFVLAHAAAGSAGDWLDAVGTPDGCVALVVGDVTGHGLDAVATMTQVHGMLRELLRRGTGPEATLRSVDALALELAGPASASVCLALLDPSSGALSYCTAGHPAPLLIGLDGAPTYLESSRDGPLGTGGDFRFVEAVLQPGELLLLYTDGAFRRHPATAEEGLDRLGTVVAEEFALLGGGHGIRGLVDRLCERVPALLAGTGDWTGDDVALVVAERMPPQPDLALELTADAIAPATARAALTTWLRELRVRDIDSIAAAHAVSEVVANAVEHAYVDRAPPASGAVVMTASLRAAGEVVVTVTDRGRWQVGGPSGPGRGLGLARSLSTGLEIERDGGGTTVTSRHPVARGVSMQRSTGRTGTTPPPATATYVEGGLVALHGDVEAACTPALREELVQFSQGGTQSLVIDLTDVSFLDSSGVRLLYEVRGWAHDDVQMRIVATSGCPAERVLWTAGLLESGLPPRR